MLVNRTSASASEIFAGAIQDYQRGLVLGGRTFGKGTVQEIIPLDFGQAKVTRSKFYRISGASTQHRGVIPDIEFPDFYDAYEDIGESSLDGALPWDTVRAVEYRPYYSIQALLPRLQARHQERAAISADFNYLLDQIERTRRYRAREQLSLNENLVKAERERNRREEFEAENLRRLLKGLPLQQWVEQEAADGTDGAAIEPALTVTNNDDPTAAVIEETGAEVEEADPLLLESGRILADFIALNDRRVSALDQLPVGR